MSVSRFLDTNILLYAFDQDAPRKRAIARKLVEDGWEMFGQSAISVQVLQELFVNLVRKNVDRELAATIVNDFAHWPVVETSLPLFRQALAEQARWQISLWDALIIVASRAVGAKELFTEDLQHGRDYDGVRVVNPFR
jgi:predicted nucleic acid-binding protein